mmetsp:Transcript_27826/g.70459  ORF Transcript_27826/g.70459 Transcript_27826/m.70459 type:complete len:95 (+) Transcript_27826:83-367(+)
MAPSLKEEFSYRINTEAGPYREACLDECHLRLGGDFGRHDRSRHMAHFWQSSKMKSHRLQLRQQQLQASFVPRQRHRHTAIRGNWWYLMHSACG